LIKKLKIQTEIYQGYLNSFDPYDITIPKTFKEFWKSKAIKNEHYNEHN